MNLKKIVIRIILGIVLLILGFFCIPQNMIIPVAEAKSNDWNSKTFWAHPWGKSGVHKGIDIFGNKGTPIISPQRGIIFFKGELGRGGKVILLLGPLFRFHYFAHLDSINENITFFVAKGDILGFMGNSGNANNTPTHLHYSIATPIPYFNKYSKTEPHGWKKMFYLNPDDFL